MATWRTDLHLRLHTPARTTYKQLPHSRDDHLGDAVTGGCYPTRRCALHFYRHGFVKPANTSGVGCDGRNAPALCSSMGGPDIAPQGRAACADCAHADSTYAQRCFARITWKGADIRKNLTLILYGRTAYDAHSSCGLLLIYLDAHAGRCLTVYRARTAHTHALHAHTPPHTHACRAPVAISCSRLRDKHLCHTIRDERDSNACRASLDGPSRDTRHLGASAALWRVSASPFRNSTWDRGGQAISSISCALLVAGVSRSTRRYRHSVCVLKRCGASFSLLHYYRLCPARHLPLSWFFVTAPHGTPHARARMPAAHLRTHTCPPHHHPFPTPLPTPPPPHPPLPHLPSPTHYTTSLYPTWTGRSLLGWILN